jgi:hypothetical protein
MLFLEFIKRKGGLRYIHLHRQSVQYILNRPHKKTIDSEETAVHTLCVCVCVCVCHRSERQM